MNMKETTKEMTTNGTIRSNKGTSPGYRCRRRSNGGGSCGTASAGDCGVYPHRSRGNVTNDSDRRTSAGPDANGNGQEAQEKEEACAGCGCSPGREKGTVQSR
jgi:hypothetical protein